MNVNTKQIRLIRKKKLNCSNNMSGESAKLIKKKFVFFVNRLVTSNEMKSCLERRLTPQLKVCFLGK